MIVKNYTRTILVVLMLCGNTTIRGAKKMIIQARIHKFLTEMEGANFIADLNNIREKALVLATSEQIDKINQVYEKNVKKVVQLTSKILEVYFNEIEKLYNQLQKKDTVNLEDIEHQLSVAKFNIESRLKPLTNIKSNVAANRIQKLQKKFDELFSKAVGLLEQRGQKLLKKVQMLTQSLF